MRSLSRILFASSRGIHSALLGGAILGGIALGQAAWGHAAWGQTVVPSRVSALTSESVRVPLDGLVLPRARQATDLGLAPAALKLQNMTLRFNLTDAQNVALSQLEADQQNPVSPRYHQWLTPETYGEQFGLSVADLATVTAWLQAQGFTDVSAARSRSFVTFSGSVAQVQSAFQTTMHTVSLNGETHVANLSAPTLPAALAGVVSTITGLTSFHLQPHVKARTVPAPDPKFTSSISGSHYIAPGDFYTIYDITTLLNNSITGTGITIAVMGQTDISLSDVAAFRSASALTLNTPAVRLYGTDPGTSSNDLEEAMLDVEWSGAVAPAASILYVNSTDVIAGSLTQAINNNVAPILTISYGDCEAGFGSANIATYNQLFRQATVQGQTILGPSGDSGATDCDYSSTSATNGLAVDFPASSPYVTGVGGTMFNEGAGTYFSSTNGAYSGSALSYIPEAVWNESSTSGLAAGGGGLSAYFTKPAYQVGTGVPNDFARDVPDIAFNAAASHDGYLFCYSGSCTNGYRNAANNLQVVGGTSVSTPAFAGIMALLEQKIATRVGNANPTIYGLANSTYYSSVFHDITTGNNASPCTAGSTNCPSGGTIGYTATTGYDLASGWGSIDVTNMVADWLLVTPSGLTGSSIGTTVSSTTVTATASTVTAGTSVTFTAKVSSATSGTTTVPTGTVQFLVDNVATGSAVTLVNGSASSTLATTGFTSGGHRITAAYSGDTTYAGSKGAFTLDITAASSPDFTLTPATASVTTAAGTTATGLTFTVSPTNGFTGSVAFTATSTGNSLNAGYVFSVNPVVISSTASGSTVFTLSAYTASAVSGTGLVRLGSSHAAAHAPRLPWTLAGGGASLAVLGFVLLPRRRRRWTGLLAALVCTGLLFASGCGDTSSASTSSTKTNSAPGTYTVLVTGTSTTTAGTTVSHNATVTFIVQ